MTPNMKPPPWAGAAASETTLPGGESSEDSQTAALKQARNRHSIYRQRPMTARLVRQALLCGKP